MTGDVRTERSDVLTINRKSFFLQLSQDPSLIHHVMKNDSVGHKVIVFDNFLLLIGVVVGDYPLSTEKQPF